jgi:sugar transferase (PEP-CTERM/EpsH1 system associated)
MKILYLTSRFPFPPDRGDRLRAFNVIASLSREHEIHLLSFVERSKELDYVKEMERYCRAVDVVHLSATRSRLNAAASLLTGLPLQVSYYSSPRMRALVDDKLNGSAFDVIMVHLFRLSEYVRKVEGTYRIVDFTDVVSRELTIAQSHRRGLSRLIYAIETPRIKKYEKAIALEFEENWLVSSRDVGTLKEMTGGRTNSIMLPNGVDIEKFKPLDGVEKRENILFVGHLGVFHNQDAVGFLDREVAPLLKPEHRSVEIEALGRYPSGLPSRFPGIRFLGYVEDINLVYNRARLCAAPLRFCTGIQNKVLEPMAAGVPVVASSLANEGIGAEDGNEILLADTPADFASAVSRIIKDPALGEEIGMRGRALVEKKFSWDLPRKRMKEVENLVKK